MSLHKALGLLVCCWQRPQYQICWQVTGKCLCSRHANVLPPNSCLYRHLMSFLACSQVFKVHQHSLPCPAKPAATPVLIAQHSLEPCLVLHNLQLKHC